MDIAILNFIQEHMRGGFLDFYMPILSNLLDNGYWILILAVILLFFKKYRIVSLYAVVGYLVAYFLAQLLRMIVNRAGPCVTNPGMFPALDGVCSPVMSFPSMHVTMAFLGVILLFKLNRIAGWIGFYFALVLAFARMYMYTEYLTDVIGGAILGVLCAMLAIWVINMIYDKIDSEKMKKIFPKIETSKRKGYY